MLISIVCPDLSQNCLGRAHVLAKLASIEFDVEVVGPMYQDQIWEPLRNEYDYKAVQTSYRSYQFATEVKKLTDKIEGDLIFASKPRMGSFGISLLSKYINDRPLILDIDDWETGFKLHEGGTLFHIKQIPHMINVNSYYYTRILEKLSSLADGITVSNSFLQSKFGGECIPHLRDPDRYDPSKYNSRDLRKELDLPMNKDLVLFFGTPHPYKGVEDLIQAVNSLENDNVQALIVGVGSNGYSSSLKNKYSEKTIFRGRQPFEEIPKWIATADIVSVPQRDGLATKGQLPAKLFDAMAMGKPIIATNISDMPSILGEWGIIAKPRSPVDLAQKIEYLIDNPREREKIGEGLRDRCIDNYSFQSRGEQIKSLVYSATYA